MATLGQQDPGPRGGTVGYAPHRLGHVNLFVADMPQTCDFLHRICGLEPTALMSKIGSGFYSNGNTHHDIGFIEVAGYARFKAKRTYVIEEPEDRGMAPGLNHFGWEMENEAELVAAYHRAVASGLRPRITDNGTSYSNYLFDPDGGQHQFYADNVRDWRTVYTGGEADLHRTPVWHPDTASNPSTAPFYDPDPQIRRVEGAPLHPMRVTHASIVTSAHEEMRRFYTEVAGLRAVAERADGRVLYLAGQSGRVDIILARIEDARRGLFQASFEVWPEDDLDDALRALERLSVPVIDYLTLPHKRSLTIAHPDGVRFEFFQRRGDGAFASDRDLATHGIAAA